MTPFGELPNVFSAAQPAITDSMGRERCLPRSERPIQCAPSLDLAGDAEYADFFAQTEEFSDSSFSADDGSRVDASQRRLAASDRGDRPLVVSESRRTCGYSSSGPG